MIKENSTQVVETSHVRERDKLINDLLQKERAQQLFKSFVLRNNMLENNVQLWKTNFSPFFPHFSKNSHQGFSLFLTTNEEIGKLESNALLFILVYRTPRVGLLVTWRLSTYVYMYLTILRRYIYLTTEYTTLHVSYDTEYRTITYLMHLQFVNQIHVEHNTCIHFFFF